MTTRIQVWDVFIRFFHWLLVLVFAGLWWTAEEGMMTRHQQLAILLLALLITRVGWGIWGSESAQFRRFIGSPKRALQHFNSLKSKTYQGSNTHNPAGGWFVLIMLLALFTQVGTGLFATDDIFFDGPLHSLVSSDLAGILTDIHEINFNVLLGVIGLHIVAVVIYRVLGHKLIEAMWHGHIETTQTQLKLRNGLIAIVISAVLAALLWWVLL